MPEGSERRRHPRIPVDSTVFELTNLADETPVGAVANISTNGLLINSAQPYQLDATLQVKLNWHGRDNPESHSMNIGITALWETPADKNGARWLGFQIIDISDEDQHMLDEIIAMMTPSASA